MSKHKTALIRLSFLILVLLYFTALPYLIVYFLVAFGLPEYYDVAPFGEVWQVFSNFWMLGHCLIAFVGWALYGLLYIAE